MKTLFKLVLLTAAMGVIASAAAGRPALSQQPVVLVSDQDNPVHVKEVRHPALLPYQGTASITTGRGGVTTTNFEPSPGPGRLVIEYVSAACSTNLDTRIAQLGIKTSVDNLPVTHSVVPVQLYTLLGARRYAVAQSTRLYHDTNVSLQPVRVLNIVAFGETFIDCSFAVSGHTVLP